MKTQGTDTWKYRKQPRTESRPFHPEDVGYGALAAAIVKQAVEDYRYADKKLKQAQFIEDKSARARATFIWERDQSINEAGDILCHELAHVAVGFGHDHDEAWEEAYNAIYKRYEQIMGIDEQEVQE